MEKYDYKKGDERLRKIAEETLKRIEEADFTEDNERLISGTELRLATTEDTWMVAKPVPISHLVMHETSLEGIRALSNAGAERIGVLNFASGKNPGGGFIRGTIAQEESLARSSNLYKSLLSCKDYYSDIMPPYYSNKMIWSPGVRFFKNDLGHYTIREIHADVISCAAPNLSGDRHNYESYVVRRCMWERISGVLDLFIEKGTKSIVLGAWGCGIFNNDPEMISDLFRRALSTRMDKFESIRFSIYDAKGTIIPSFKNDK